jgi:hypothetical protein
MDVKDYTTSINQGLLTVNKIEKIWITTIIFFFLPHIDI